MVRTVFNVLEEASLPMVRTVFNVHNEASLPMVRTVFNVHNEALLPSLLSVVNVHNGDRQHPCSGEELRINVSRVLSHGPGPTVVNSV